MITGQNYRAWACYANLSPQTARNTASTSIAADNRQVKALSFDLQAADKPTLLSALSAMIDWANRSTLYVKRRNRISRSEKQTVYAKLDAYKDNLEKALLDYGRLSSEPTTDDYAYLLKGILNDQAKLNLYAKHYEFPLFALPNGIYQPTHFFRYLFEVTSSSLDGVIWQGDQLACTAVDATDYPLTKAVVVLLRDNPRKPREPRIGWLKSVGRHSLTLSYDHPRLKEKQGDYMIPLKQVVQLYKIETVSREVE